MKLWMLLKDGRIVSGNYEIRTGEAASRIFWLRDNPPPGLLEWGQGEPPERVVLESERLKADISAGKEST